MLSFAPVTADDAPTSTPAKSDEPATKKRRAVLVEGARVYLPVLCFNIHVVDLEAEEKHDTVNITARWWCAALRRRGALYTRLVDSPDGACSRGQKSRASEAQPRSNHNGGRVRVISMPPGNACTKPHCAVVGCKQWLVTIPLLERAATQKHEVVGAFSFRRPRCRRSAR